MTLPFSNHRGVAGEGAEERVFLPPTSRFAVPAAAEAFLQGASHLGGGGDRDVVF
ncbi:hypothetical protein [Streptomyces sp. NPDC056255]|uniref:hypothetical protein n=1 Tax=Streptomyces sp. NPDC056255 TaxID=3345764 RepID=UPI0035D8E142